MLSSFRYLRKSRDEAADPEVLAKHAALLSRTAQSDGVTIRPENCYEEIGSAEWIEERPRFQSLLQVIESLAYGTGGVVYVTELSRLSRGLLSQQGRVEDALMRAAVKIRTPSRYYDLNNFDDRLSFHLEGIISNAEYEMTKRRLARGKRELLLVGRVRNAQVPYGYEWVKGAKHPRVVQEQFETLKLMCRDAREMSFRRIALKYGLPFWIVRDALTSPMICGYPAQRYRSHSEPGRVGVRLLPRGEWIWPEKPGEYPAVVTREEWDSIQAAISTRVKGKERHSEAKGWCRDVVHFVGNEGHVTLGVYWGGRRTYLTYALKRPPAASLYVARDTVHTAVEETLWEVLSNSAKVRHSLVQYEALSQKQRSSGTTGADQLMREVERLRRQNEAALRREIAAETANDMEEVASLARVRAALRQGIARASEELQAVQRRARVVPAVDAALPLIAVIGDQWRSVLAQANDSEMRLIANAFIERVDVVTEKIPGVKEWRREVTGVEVRSLWLE